MKTVFLITWLILTIIYLVGVGLYLTVLLLDIVKRIQNRIHNWVNGNNIVLNTE